MLVSSGGCRMARRPAAAAPHDMGRAAAGFKPAHADVKNTRDRRASASVEFVVVIAVPARPGGRRADAVVDGRQA